MWCCENAAALARRGERSLDSSASLSLQRAARAAITTDQLTCAQSRRVKGQLRWAYARGQDLKGSKQVKDHHHAGPRFGLPWCTHDGIPSHSHARSQQRQHNKVLLLLFHFIFFLPTHIHLFIRRHRKRQHQHPLHHSHPSSPPPSRPPPLPRTWPDGDEERERWVCVRAGGIGSIPLLFLFYCPLCGNGRMSDWAVGIHWVHVLLCLRLSLLLHLHVSLFLRDGLMDGHTPHKYVYIHTT